MQPPAARREAFQRDIAQRLQAHMAQSGYRAADAPIIQDAGLFLTRAGDQIINRLFTFDHRGHTLALRPEFTTPALQRYLREYGDEQPPSIVRWQFQGAVFEDIALTDRQQHFNIGTELIGMRALLADAESIALAISGLAQCGISGVIVQVGHVQFVRAALTSLGIEARTQALLLQHMADLLDPARGKAFVMRALEPRMPLDLAETNTAPSAEAFDSSSHLLETILASGQRQNTMGGRTNHEILQRLTNKRRRTADRAQITRALDLLEQWALLDLPTDAAFDALAQTISDSAAQAALDELRELVALLEAMDVSRSQIRIQPALPRNWEYYTGMVFQIELKPAHWESMPLNARSVILASGGRYDELARLLGAPHAVPAVGFVYYVDEFPATDDERLGGETTEVAIALRAGASVSPYALIQWSRALRERDFDVEIGIEAPCAHSRLELVVGGDGTISYGGECFSFDALQTLCDALADAFAHMNARARKRAHKETVSS